MNDLTSFTVADALAGLQRKDFSAKELVSAYIAALEKGRSLNAFITETLEQAVEAAETSDARYAAGSALPLDGIPIGMKDLFCTKGISTTAASRILEGFKPVYESTVSANLCSSNETSYFGPVRNPWKSADGADLVPGGSSGGSTAAVAAGLVAAATGTDTGGSIRQPAALTGTVGMKPTYGRCSRWGIVAFASSLDQAGPITQNVRDAALMLQSMAGHDPKDSTSLDAPLPDFSADLDAGVKGLKIGIPAEYHMDGMPAEIETLWEEGKRWLKDAGAETVDISLPHTKYALPTYYIIAPAEASSNLARYDGVRYGLRVPGETIEEMYERTRAEGFGREVERRVLIGTYVLSAGYYDAYYLKAQKVRTLISNDFRNAFEKVDAILTPSTPSAAFPIGAKMADPLEMYLNDIFTVPVNLAGLPAISVPAGLDGQGLPLGLHVIAPALDEVTLFKVAQTLENAAQFGHQPSRWWEDA